MTRDLSQEFFRCWACKTTKLKTEFPQNPGSRRGVKPNCNTCVALNSNTLKNPGRPVNSKTQQNPLTHRCRACGEVKSKSEFYKSLKLKAGVQSTCMECRRKQIREYQIRRAELTQQLLQDRGLTARPTQAQPVDTAISLRDQHPQYDDNLPNTEQVAPAFTQILSTLTKTPSK